MRSRRRSSVFLEAGHSGKMGKTKKKTNARVAGRRKQIKECTAEQLCMDNISMDLNESNDSSISDSSEESLSPSLLFLFPNFYRTFLFSYPNFLPSLYDSYNFICVANFRFFTHRCIFIRSSLFSLFRTSPCF